MLYFVDWTEKELWTLVQTSAWRVRIGEGLLGTVARDGTCFNLRSDLIGFEPEIDERCSNALYVPIGKDYHRECVAVLQLMNKASDFTSDDESMMEAYAEQVALVLRRRSNEMEYIRVLSERTMNVNSAHSHANFLECCTISSVQPDKSSSIRQAEAWSSSPRTELRKAVKVYDEENPHLVPSWDFNAFEASNDTLILHVERMYLDFNLLALHGIKRETLRNFILNVSCNYHPNPFHNFTHGFSVMHVTYLILTSKDGPRILSTLDVLACLTAALCHDIDHPGHNNAFEVNSRSNLALQHNDDSVLERHHAYSTFRIMMKETDSNILESLTASDYSHVRQMMITAILGTDMAYHFDHYKELDLKLNQPTKQLGATATGLAGIIRGDTSSNTRALRKRATFMKTLTDRTFLVKTIVHAADLSGQVLPKELALKWGNMVVKEFAYQSLMEESENMPSTFSSINNALAMVEGQYSFSSRLVLPLWELLPAMYPALTHCVTNLHENLRHYEIEIARLQNQDCTNPNACANACGQAIPGCTAAKFVSFRVPPSNGDKSCTGEDWGQDLAVMLVEDDD